MDRTLLGKLELICPRCRVPTPKGIAKHALAHKETFLEEQGFVLEGLLVCSNPRCRAIYPVVEGVPILLKDLRTWYNARQLHSPMIQARAPELRSFLESQVHEDANLLADRSLLGSYMDSHYHDRTATRAPPMLSQARSFLQAIAEAARPLLPGGRGTVLDLGCSVGRLTFELARNSDLAVGMDTNFTQVAAAAAIQRTQALRYTLKRGGTAFELVEGSFPAPQNVLFLVGDALDPPFEAEGFDLVAALNLLDSVKLPLVLIGQMDALLKSEGTLILGTPYAWREDICDQAEWLETKNMDASGTVRQILEGHLFPSMDLRYHVLQDLAEVPWVLRQDERHWSLFLVHLLVARKG